MRTATMKRNHALFFHPSFACVLVDTLRKCGWILVSRLTQVPAVFSSTEQYYSVRRSVSKNRIINIYNVIRHLCYGNRPHPIYRLYVYLYVFLCRSSASGECATLVKSIEPTMKIFAVSIRSAFAVRNAPSCRLFHFNSLQKSTEI